MRPCRLQWYAPRFYQKCYRVLMCCQYHPSALFQSLPKWAVICTLLICFNVSFIKSSYSRWFYIGDLCFISRCYWPSKWQQQQIDNKNFCRIGVQLLSISWHPLHTTMGYALFVMVHYVVSHTHVMNSNRQSHWLNLESAQQTLETSWFVNFSNSDWLGHYIRKTSNAFSTLYFLWQIHKVHKDL
jgi:hypothetical protein